MILYFFPVSDSFVLIVFSVLWLSAHVDIAMRRNNTEKYQYFISLFLVKKWKQIEK